MTPSAAPQHTTDANSSPPVTHYRTATVDDLDIFYREAGPANGSAIVLLHGFPTSSHMFRNLIPLLADRYHVIAPDYPGFGLSPAPDHAAFDYGFGRYADLMDNLLEKLGVQRFARPSDIALRSSTLSASRRSSFRTATPTKKA